jgi:hypothetical protein
MFAREKISYHAKGIPWKIMLFRSTSNKAVAITGIGNLGK